VGDGTQIKIWEDNWLPGSPDLKVQTPRGRNLVATVNELINPIDANWDVDLVVSLFLPDDARSILKIPLSQGREDMVAWHYNRSGMFSVRSAYHCQWTSKFENEDQTAVNGLDNQVWKRLWKLSIPGKIKIHGWRSLNSLIPCKGILFNRHVIDNAACLLCQTSSEDIKHMMFTCGRAKSIWNFLGIGSQIDRLAQGGRSGQQMIEETIRSGGNVQSLNNVGLPELILTGGWYIW